MRPLPCGAGAIERKRVSFGPQETNPGAIRAKEIFKLKGVLSSRCPRLRVRDWVFARSLVKTQTTLGNGYLGSRIDEERSEMRYLV